ncbi:MAG: hypothetical protein R3A78_07495 [Polyangiales bacterium]|nr:hypothetical protein [Myxococcales bacterium]
MTGRTPHTLTWFARAFACVALAGCAESNAIFEAILEVPASDGDARYVAVDARRGETAIADGDYGLVHAPLDGGSTELSVEVVARDGDIGAPFRMRIAYCASPHCDGNDDATAPPELEITFDHAHYEGERTRWRATLPTIAATREASTPIELHVDRCQIEGCRSGEATSWCRNDGTHFCE